MGKTKSKARKGRVWFAVEWYSTRRRRWTLFGAARDGSLETFGTADAAKDAATFVRKLTGAKTRILKIEVVS